MMDIREKAEGQNTKMDDGRPGEGGETISVRKRQRPDAQNEDIL